MKFLKFNSKLSIIIVALIIAASCNFSNKNKEKHFAENAVVMPDTTIILRTDSVNPEWNAKLDSMLRTAATAKQDTNLAKLYMDIGDMYANINSEKAKEYYLKLRTLSENLKWNEGLYQFAAGFTNILNREGLMDSAIIIHQQVLELAKKELNDERIAKISIYLGNCYNYKDWFTTALKYYSDALPFFEKRNDKFKLAHIYYLMGTVYNRMNMQDENFLYCEKALNIFNEKPDTLYRAYALINYSVALIQRNELEKAKNCLFEAKRICTLNNNRYSLLDIYSNLCDISFKKFDLENMEMYSRKMLDAALEFDDAVGYSISNRTLGFLEMYRGNFNKAEKYLKEALKTANEFDLTNEKWICYGHLLDLSMYRRDFSNARFYRTKADSTQNVLDFEKTRLFAKEMEVKYETEKKELKITALEKEKKLMIWLSIAGGAALLLVLATFFFLWRWTIQKRKLAETRIKQFEQEKQLVATQAVLDGETQERSRLARDLHDGLGSMLTGVKMNLADVKTVVVLAPAEVERFNNAMTLLDESITEMRRVAHHLMPDSLNRAGLKPAVSDFCSTVSPKVVFDYFGDNSRLDPMLEIVIYRSIHELVNNALKHSGASQILVQIMQEPDRIAFTVQDDGCGFNPAAVTNGAGLQNIRNRIASFGGNINIDTKTNEGTEINVEFKI